MMINLILESIAGQIVIGVLIVIAAMTVPSFIFGVLFEKAEKESEKGNEGCLTIMLIIGFIAIIITFIAGIKDCTNDSPWEPRHTQLQKGQLNNVKTLTFTPCKA